MMVEVPQPTNPDPQAVEVEFHLMVTRADARIINQTVRSAVEFTLARLGYR